MLLRCKGNKTPFRGCTIIIELGYKKVSKDDILDVDHTMGNNLINKYGIFEEVKEEPKQKRSKIDYKKKVVGEIIEKEESDGSEYECPCDTITG